ncbi:MULTISPECIES: hypothetical protein [Actinomadura]|uniref:Caspase family protein n=1 Tax=Actinomadura yumaensis TaxID=111807 RepID=A0ABW2CDJ0_9ACTN|nr:hypothetical protein [Actinomadura sp. J1-007]MWK38296.1 hypothetical protein [Actinomadura sp. J1-007]
MVRLPDRRRSAALLIGTGTYESGQLPDLPSVHNNLVALRGLLTDAERGVFSPELCDLVEDVREPRELGVRIADTARWATDVLLVYFSGHGLLDTRGRLHLAVTASSPATVGYGGLPFERVREEIAGSPAAVRC